MIKLKMLLKNIEISHWAEVKLQNLYGILEDYLQI